MGHTGQQIGRMRFFIALLLVSITVLSMADNVFSPEELEQFHQVEPIPEEFASGEEKAEAWFAKHDSQAAELTEENDQLQAKESDVVKKAEKSPEVEDPIAEIRKDETESDIENFLVALALKQIPKALSVKLYWHKVNMHTEQRRSE